MGTFITRSADGPVEAHGPIQRELVRCIRNARRAGLDDDSIAALFSSALRAAGQEGVA